MSGLRPKSMTKLVHLLSACHLLSKTPRSEPRPRPRVAFAGTAAFVKRTVAGNGLSAVVSVLSEWRRSEQIHIGASVHMVDDIVFVALVWYGLVIRLRNPFGSWWPLGLRRILRIIAIFKVLPANCAPNCRFQRRAPTNIEWLMAIWDTTLHLTPIKHDGKSPRNRWFFHLFPDKKIRGGSIGWCPVRRRVSWEQLLHVTVGSAKWSLLKLVRSVLFPYFCLPILSLFQLLQYNPGWFNSTSFGWI